MKFLSFLCLLTLFSCANEAYETKDVIQTDSISTNVVEDPLNTTEQQTETVEINLPKDEVEGKRVFFANVGIYGSPAILVLDVKEADEINGDGDFCEVSGYYFYVKRQKNLQLEGGLDIINQEFRLTESYKGKETGFFSFSLNDPSLNYWATSEEAAEHQDLKIQEIAPIDAERQNFTFAMEKHVYEHQVMDMGAEEETWEDVEDDIGLVFINDDLLAFNLHVVRINFHMGGASGLAKKTTDSTYVWLGEGGCELTLKITEQTIETIDNGCDYYHGFRATLDADFDR